MQGKSPDIQRSPRRLHQCEKEPIFYKGFLHLTFHVQRRKCHYTALQKNILPIHYTYAQGQTTKTKTSKDH